MQIYDVKNPQGFFFQYINQNFLVTFNLEKLIIFVNSIKRIPARTFLGLPSETTICNNLTAKVSVKCINCFAICASLKLTDLVSLISIFCNVQDHKLD